MIALLDLLTKVITTQYRRLEVNF